MGFKSWLTGRNDLYADHDKIDSVIEQLQGIKTHDLKTAKEEIGEAIQALNACTGFQQYVCNTLKADSFDDVIDASGEAIDTLVAKIEGKVDDMKAYSEAGFMKHAFSTALMAGAKFGEGILSVGEDLGDGVVSVIGWLAPKDSGVEKWCEKFVKKEWSHDAFNFYYKSNLAKASLFTEDSAAASAFKIAGSVTGYLALGGVVSGAGGVAANSGSKVLKAVGTFAKSTTRVNTLTAAVTGMGAGTESGLRQGLDINKAAHKGVKQAAIQGALAYGAGKYGESLQKKNAIKAAEDKVDDMTSEVTKAKETFNTKTASHNSATDKAIEAADDYGTAKQAYEEALAKQNVYDEPKAALNKAYQEKNAVEKELNELTGKLDDAIANNNKSLYDDISAKITAKNQELKQAGDKVKAALDNVPKQSKASFETNMTNINKTSDALQKAEKTFESAKDVAVATETEKISAQEALDTALTQKKAAEKALETTKNAKLSDFQGYSDPITRAGQKLGSGEVSIRGAIAERSGDLFKTSLKDKAGSVAEKAGSLKDGAKSAITNVKEMGVKGVATKVKDGVAAAPKAVVNAGKGIAATTKDVATKAGPSILSTTKDVATKVGPGIATAVKSAAAPGVAGATLNAVGREIANKTGGSSGDASNQFKTKFENKYNGVQEDAKTDDKVDNSGNESTSSTEPSSSTGSEPTGGSSNSNSTGQPHYSNPSGGGSSSNGGTTTESVLSSSTTTTPTSATPAESITEVTATAAPAVETPTEQPTTVDPNTTPTTPPTTQTTEAPQQVDNITVPISSEPTYHSGGGYSDGGGYVGFEPETSETVETPNTTDGVPGIDEEEIDISTGIDNIVKGDTITKLPVSNDKLEQKSGGSSLIPIAAGLSAAAAAGLGAKAYIDHRRNNSNEDEEFDSDEWSGDESTDFEYDNSANEVEYLDDDDYTASPEAETEKYGARNNEELADLQ